MERVRLHALRAVTALLILVVLGITSCSGSKQKEVSNTPKDGLKPNETPTINYADYKVYVSSIKEVQEISVVSLYHEMGSILISPLEWGEVTKKNVLLFDVKEYGYVKKYAVQQPFEYGFLRASGFRLVGDILTIDYSGLLSPNTEIALYKSKNWYVSVYRDSELNEFSVIGSRDLTRWEQTSVSSPSPILLYERNDGVYALAGRTVWNVTEIDRPVLVKELDTSIMKPEIDRKPWEEKDQGIVYSFNIDNYIITHVLRVSEYSGTMLFIAINLDDFSYKVTSAEEITLGPYNYKAVKRDDGWKVYYIGRDPADGILVLDPLAENGPAVIERLPGVNIPPSQ